MRYLLSIILCLWASCAWAFPPGFIGAVTQGGVASLLSVTDDFEGTDENPLTGWTTMSNKISMKSVSGVAKSSTGADAGALYTASTFTSDQKSTITIGTFAAYMGVGVRFSTSANTGYIAQATSTTKIRLYRNVNNVQTDVSGAGYTIAALVLGDTISVEATGSNPVVLIVKVNGAQVGTYSDSTAPVTGGYPTIYATSTTGTISTWTGANL